MAYFYTFNPPESLNGSIHTKPGITNSVPDGRLGKYQLPYGPYWEAHYTWLCYHPELQVIKRLEDSVLGHFRFRCSSIGAGMTEWLMNTTWQEIRDYVLMITKDTQTHIVDFGEGPWSVTQIQKKIYPMISRGEIQ